MNAAVWGMALIVAAGMVVLIAVIAEVRVILHHEKQRRMREEQRVIDGTAVIRAVPPAYDLARPPVPEPDTDGLGSQPTAVLPVVEYPARHRAPAPVPPLRPLLAPPLPVRPTWAGATQTIAALRTGVDRLAFAAITAAETGVVPDLPAEVTRTETTWEQPPLAALLSEVA